MSEPSRQEGYGESLITCSELWNKNTEKQRRMWVMMSDAPVLTPINKEWDLLAFYSQQKLFDAWLGARETQPGDAYALHQSQL